MRKWLILNGGELFFAFAKLVIDEKGGVIYGARVASNRVTLKT